jgi:uncharacterized protein YjbK
MKQTSAEHLFQALLAFVSLFTTKFEAEGAGGCIMVDRGNCGNIRDYRVNLDVSDGNRGSRGGRRRATGTCALSRLGSRGN